MMPEQPEGYRLLGEFYLATGDFAKAAAEYASLYQQHPKDLFVRKRYIELLIRDKQLEPANELNEAILGENSRDTDALVTKGQILNRQQKSAEAIPILESVVRNTPANALGHLELGVSYASTGKPVLAEREFREALKRLIGIFLIQKEPEKAVRLAQAQVAKFPESGSDHLLLAKALLANQRI